jgi:hypothetical protein
MPPLRYHARMKRRLLAASALLWLGSCSPTPPAQWVQGGALLQIPRARWVYGDSTLDITPDGKIYIQGEHELTLDRAGRLIDLNADPVALLLPDGRVVGPDDKALGTVGAIHAALPGELHAWLSLTGTGEVIRYDDEGDRTPFGFWYGCNLSFQSQQACTLVTHLVAMRAREAAAARQNSNYPVPAGPTAPGFGFAPGIPFYQ